MITKRFFNLFIVFGFIYHYLLANVASCLIAYYVYTNGYPQVALPFTPFGILGACIAILLGESDSRAVFVLFQLLSFYSLFILTSSSYVLLRVCY